MSAECFADTGCFFFDYFMSKSEQEQKEMIHRAQQLQSDEEMLRYVEGLAKKNDTPIL